MVHTSPELDALCGLTVTGLHSSGNHSGLSDAWKQHETEVYILHVCFFEEGNQLSFSKTGGVHPLNSTYLNMQLPIFGVPY